MPLSLLHGMALHLLLCTLMLLAVNTLSSNSSEVLGRLCQFSRRWGLSMRRLRHPLPCGPQCSPTPSHWVLPLLRRRAQHRLHHRLHHLSLHPPRHRRGRRRRHRPRRRRCPLRPRHRRRCRLAAHLSQRRRKRLQLRGRLGLQAGREVLQEVQHSRTSTPRRR